MDSSRLDNCITWRHRKWIFLALGVLEMFWFGGYYYGYNALKENYKNLGVFEDQCSGEDCSKQEMMFNYAFNSWVNVQMVLISGAGFIMDRFGLRLLKLLAVALYFLGTLMFAFTSRVTSALLFPAGILVALGSTSSLICNHQISSMFPKAQGLVIALISGAFDSSTVITFIITKVSTDVPLQTSFVVVGVVALIFGSFMGAFVLTQWAPDMAKFGIDNHKEPYTENDFKIESGQSNNASLMDVDKRLQTAVTNRFPTLKSCIFSLPFLAITFWFQFGLLRFAYFLTQLVPILDYYFPNEPEKVRSLLKISSTLFMAGFVVSPFTGFVLVRSKSYYRKKVAEKLIDTNGDVSDDELYWLFLRSMAPGFLLLAISGVIFSVLQFVKSQVTFYISCILFTVYRSLLFSASVNFILIAFPLKNFGTVNGLVNTIGGLFNLLENALRLAPILPGTGISVGISCALFITPLFLFFKRH